MTKYEVLHGTSANPKIKSLTNKKKAVHFAKKHPYTTTTKSGKTKTRPALYIDGKLISPSRIKRMKEWG